MSNCYIGLGSNLGDRKKNIKSAIGKINQLEKTKVMKISSVIETLPVGGPKQGKFLNAAIEIKTGLSPRELLVCLQRIEYELGRKRAVKNGPRTIDLDILLFDDKKINDEDLIVPHQRIKEREFVLMPLKEVSSNLVKRFLNESNKKDRNFTKRN